MSQWYSKCYRRNLVDMHIADPLADKDWQNDHRFDNEFFSKFSPEEYVENLKIAHIQSTMIYAQSHAGHCYYPTKVGHMHSAFQGREDLMRRTVDLCHKNGIYVTGYYSLIYNTYEEDRHSEWRMISLNEETSMRERGGRYGHCCPNNPEYRAFVEEQIKEISEYFSFDGMFYDMTFWSDYCHCEHCMKKYREVGIEVLPPKNWEDPAFRRVADVRIQMMGEFAAFVTAVSRKYMPHASVEHNYAQAVAAWTNFAGSSELINDQCDYTGGDLYGDLYNHSFNAKYYHNVTKNHPFEYMICRCDATLKSHTTNKSEAHLTTEILLTAAHHGASFIIDAIDPAGTLDRRVYERIGKAFEKQLPYEAYFSGDMLTDVGVYFSTTGKYNSHGLEFTTLNCSVGATRALIEAHIPIGVLANSTTKFANRYRMILAPAIAGISQENRDDLYKYVSDGGILYISGTEEPALLQQFFDVTSDRFTEEGSVYLCPTPKGQAIFGDFTPAYPMPGEMPLPILSKTPLECEILATMTLPYTKLKERKFASIHSNPPGIPTDIPALITKKVGNGRVIWSALPIEFDSRLSHRRVLADLTRTYLGTPSVTTTAPRQVELISFRREKDILISAVDLLCTDELLPIRDFTITLQTNNAPSKVYLLENGEKQEIFYDYNNGKITFSVTDMVMFRMYRITF